MTTVRGLTVKSNPGGLLRSIHSPVFIAQPFTDPNTNPEKVSSELNGVWDTGATGSVITQKVIDELKLKPVGMTLVNTASARDVPTPEFIVDLVLPNKVVIQGLRVTQGELAGIDVLIGMDVIMMGDFHISNYKGNTQMSFSVPSVSPTEYSKTLAGIPDPTLPKMTDSNGRLLPRSERRKLEREQKKHERNKRLGL